MNLNIDLSNRNAPSGVIFLACFVFRKTQAKFLSLPRNLNAAQFKLDKVLLTPN